jgi:hypothetical protein
MHRATAKKETSEGRYRVFAVGFGVVFSIIYPLVVVRGWQLFTYYPKVGKWVLLNQPANVPTPGPGMHWYGFIATTAIIAAIVGLIASLIPENLIKRIWWLGLIWIVPILSMIVVAVLIFVKGD